MNDSTGTPQTTPQAQFRDELFAAGLLYPTGVEGLYGRSADFTAIAAGVDRLVSAWAREVNATEISFPPVMPRTTFHKTGYLHSFPDLMGSVHVFGGDDQQHRELVERVESDGDWQELLEPADVVLAPAACHPLYPLCSGRLPDGGRLFEVNGYCFRHEPSDDPARMQAFRMHELVYIGTPDGAQQHRDRGLERGLQELRQLGLEMDAVPANDPFFGRAGRLLAAGQRSEALKLEGIASVSSDEKPTAIMSANCHRDHFGRDFAIETAEGEVAHSSCVGFGVDRITLALLRAHGLDSGRWPRAVTARLGL